MLGPVELEGVPDASRRNVLVAQLSQPSSKLELYVIVDGLATAPAVVGNRDTVGSVVGMNVGPRDFVSVHRQFLSPS